MKKLALCAFAAGSLALMGCQSMIDKAKKEAKYSAYEMVGVEKRDLFKKEVKKVQSSQEDTSEAFKDALEKLQKIYAFDGGNLERQYKSLNSSYEDAQKEVASVHERVKTLETTAEDLFKEWEGEIQQISAADLRRKSSENLRATRQHYNQFHASLKKSEKSMDPVLQKLKDHVLYMKHNLNAKAIAGLKVESDKIQNDIAALIKNMNDSIAQAESFAKTID
ncbi:hypothetical protein AZI86_04045 [Bdellovibrio bacteriovorus]|uniref:DNA repair protein n=1 Tax=Bdellovibrio bacteriovorus TaxID=959 RepID=A0A150WP87_BDEBC|nr:DUF2959 family protein [Bdellovibrio bacteriovorus]KYG66240.1 hypothetical protein AZI86_04045 [Bdellovibrio bacteriovorus]